jgi:hypothetical protein
MSPGRTMGKAGDYWESRYLPFIENPCMISATYRCSCLTLLLP